MEQGYMTLCLHCESYLPPRTFRRHRLLYFKLDSNTWEKDPDLASSSSDDSEQFMEVDNDSISPPSSPLFHDHNDSEVGKGQRLLDQEIWDGNHVSKMCTFVRFPNHRQRRMRKPCGAILLKEVTLSGGTLELNTEKERCMSNTTPGLYMTYILTFEVFN